MVTTMPEVLGRILIRLVQAEHAQPAAPSDDGEWVLGVGLRSIKPVAL